MRTRVIPFVALLMLLSIPMDIGADDPIPANDLIVDELWIDIIQDDSRKLLDVVEFIFFNNTGSSTFNGSVYSWIPEGAQVMSKCCGNAPNMACRMDEGGSMLCFDILAHDENIVYGQPFEPSTFMSYFGQKGTLVIDGTAQNTSNSDTFFLNVTVGQGQVLGDFPTVTGDGLNITSNAEQLGVVAVIPADSSGMPERLGLIQPINITNKSPFNDTVDLEMSGLPEGWTAQLFADGVAVESISVLSNESKEILLHMQIPTYKIEIQLSYVIPVEGANDPEAEYLYQKELLYYNDFIEIFVYLLADDELIVGENLLELLVQWNEQQQRMWYAYHKSNLSANDRISFTIAWENQADYSLLALAITLLVVGGLIGYLFYRKKYAGEEKKAVEEGSEAEPSTEPTSELEEKKRTMLLAIKRLKSDHEDGKIPDEVYEELLTQYKKSTVEVMKEIDGLK